MGVTPTQRALEDAAEVLRTHTAPTDAYWTSCTKAMLLAFCETMDEHYVGDIYLEMSFSSIAEMVRLA